MRLVCLWLALASLFLALPSWAEEDRFLEARQGMVAGQIEARGVKDPKVLKAMLTVPRHRFVAQELLFAAYEDRPLPIGFGQTISQPYIVAYMTEVLKLTGQEKVLEIGTGSGYQAAILAEVAGQVFSIEIIPELYKQAGQRLAELGYGQIRLLNADGYYGWPEEAPFDGIIVTCAAAHIPPPLLTQLKPGGRMVIPVGQPFFIQDLILAEKDQDGRLTTRSLLPVAFVPLVHPEGGKD